MNNHRTNILKTIIIGLILILMRQDEQAQSATASLSGTVTDERGAVVAGAEIKAVNDATNLVRKTATNADGFFTLPLLPPGVYTLNVERQGFAPAGKRDLTLNVGDQRSLLIQLKVGAVSAAVTVEAEGLGVQSQGVDIAGIINERRVRELPLNGKNFQRLVLLAPGVSGFAAGSNTNPAIGGARPVNNTYTVDGIGANDERQAQGVSLAGGAAGFAPFAPNLVSTEAIQEFRIITANADATFGRGSGGQINVVTKSGTNKLHGSAYENLRNNIFDARDFFNLGPFFDSRGRAVVPPFRQNQFGGAIGGPLAKDRHFYFGSYEGFRQRLQQTSSAVVPNGALINLIPGDLGRFFRAYLIDRGVVPASGVLAGGTFTPLARDQATAAPYVSAGFNQALFDQNPGNGEAGTITLSLAPPQDIDQDAFLIRTDHQLTSRLSASARYNFTQAALTNNAAGLPGGERQTLVRYQSAMAQLVYTLSPSQVVEARAGLLRSRSVAEPLGGFDSRLVDIGVSPQLGVLLTITGLSQVSISGSAGFSDFQTVPQFSALHTWTRGKLTLRSGADMRWLIINLVQENSATPAYSFTGMLGANGILGANAAQQQAVASSVFASVFGQSGPFTTMRGWRSTQQEYFAQADYRLRRSVTVNAGLRYSYFGVYTEANNAISNLYAVDLSGNIAPDVSPFRFGRTANVIAQTASGRPFYQPDRNNFQPRLGIAWDIGGRGRTVVRAGYGLYVDRLYHLQFTSVAFNPPFAVSSSVSNAPFLLTGSLPVNPQTPSLAAVDPTIRNPYTQQFNVAVEQKLGANTSVTAAYAGARGHKLLRWSEPNGFGSVPQSLRPDPRFTDERLITNDSSSRYNSLQIAGRRRLALGLRCSSQPDDQPHYRTTLRSRATAGQ